MSCACLAAPQPPTGNPRAAPTAPMTPAPTSMSTTLRRSPTMTTSDAGEDETCQTCAMRERERDRRAGDGPDGRRAGAAEERLRDAVGPQRAEVPGPGRMKTNDGEKATSAANSAPPTPAAA